ncbi:MAG: hypothetical protein ACYCUI_09545 [Vulcanimicrobiaceae bacterium]
MAVSRALFGSADGTGSRRTRASLHLASLLHAAHAASRSAGPEQDAVAFDWRGRACWITLDADPDGGPDQATVGILDDTIY